MEILTSSKPQTKFRTATWNVGSLAGRSNEVAVTLERRNVDLCGIQEHKYKGALRPAQCKYFTAKSTRYNSTGVFKPLGLEEPA